MPRELTADEKNTIDDIITKYLFDEKTEIDATTGDTKRDYVLKAEASVGDILSACEALKRISGVEEIHWNYFSNELIRLRDQERYSLVGLLLRPITEQFGALQLNDLITQHKELSNSGLSAGGQLFLRHHAAVIASSTTSANLDEAFNAAKQQSLVILQSVLFQKKYAIDKEHLNQLDPTQVDMRNTNFSGANLSNTNLAKKDLIHTILTGANLTGANLTGANLTGADLTDIVIDANTKLTGANLTGANLTGADLTDIVIDGNTKLTGAKLPDAKQVQYQFADGTRVTLTQEKFAGAIKEINETEMAISAPRAVMPNILNMLQTAQQDPESRHAKAVKKALLDAYKEHLMRDENGNKHPVTMDELRAFLKTAEQYGLMNANLCNGMTFANDAVKTEANMVIAEQGALSEKQFQAVLTTLLDSQKKQDGVAAVWSTPTPPPTSFVTVQPVAAPSAEPEKTTVRGESDAELEQPLISTPSHSPTDFDTGRERGATASAPPCRYFMSENRNHITIIHTEIQKEGDLKKVQENYSAVMKSPFTQLGQFTGGRTVNQIIPEKREDGSYQLRIVSRAANEDPSKKEELVIRPGDIGASNDSNSGRFVCAMMMQAAGLAKDGLPITKENLKASPAVHRAHHFKTQGDFIQGLQNVYVKPLKNDSTSEERVTHWKQKLACLKAEYESRAGHQDREHHGSSPSRWLQSIFHTEYSATKKLDAVTEIEKKIDTALKDSQPLSYDDLPLAARQGELGRTMKGLIEAMNSMSVSHRPESPR